MSDMWGKPLHQFRMFGDHLATIRRTMKLKQHRITGFILCYFETILQPKLAGCNRDELV